MKVQAHDIFYADVLTDLWDKAQYLDRRVLVAVFLGMVTLIAVAGLYILVRRVPRQIDAVARLWLKRSRGKTEMTKRQRKAHVKRIVAADWADVLERDYANDVISREERDYFYRVIAYNAGMAKYLPTKRLKVPSHQKLAVLKQEIKERLNGKVATPEPKLPDATQPPRRKSQQGKPTSQLDGMLLRRKQKPTAAVM